MGLGTTVWEETERPLRKNPLIPPQAMLKGTTATRLTSHASESSPPEQSRGRGRAAAAGAEKPYRSYYSLGRGFLMQERVRAYRSETHPRPGIRSDSPRRSYRCSLLLISGYLSALQV